MIQSNITKALYLADGSAKRQYENLKENGYYSNIISGNISQQIAGKFKVFLDYSHTRIILEPNSTFADPMERATAGMALTTEGKDRATVRITDVLDNSPASEARLQKDDLLLRVDGKATSELTLTRISEMFEKQLTYKLTVRRGE